MQAVAMLMVVNTAIINIVFHVEHRGGDTPHLRNPHGEGVLNSVKNGRTVVDLKFSRKIFQKNKVFLQLRQ